MRSAKRLAAVGLVGIVVLGVGPAIADEIHVGKELLERISKDSAKKQRLFQVLGQSGDWKITDVTMRNVKMRALGFNVQMPDAVPAFINAIRIDNCFGLATSRALNHSKAVTDSTTMTNGKTFGYGVEASAEVSFGFGKAGAKVSQTGSFTNSEATNHSQTVTVAETITVNVPAQRMGVISALFADQVDAKSLPFTARFRPDDGSEFEFALAKQVGAGDVCVYEHTGYGGRSKCYQLGAEVNNFAREGGGGFNFNKQITSLKLPQGASVTMWERSGFNGKSITYTQSSGNVGGEWNDRFSSMKVAKPETVKPSVTFGKLKNLLSEKDQEFTITGQMTVKKTDIESKEVINYEMDKDEFEARCRSVQKPLPKDAGGTAKVAGSKDTAAASRVGSVQAAGPTVTAISAAEFNALKGKLKRIAK